MTTMSEMPIPPPSPQEIHRKLSVHAKPKASTSHTSTPKALHLSASPGTLSGTESDSDSQLVSADTGSPPTHVSVSTSIFASGSQQPLQSIAERRAASGDESDEDDDEEGEWRVADKGKQQEDEESVIKSGYLWKKGSRRKTWKKRWFVLRPPHLAYYKTSAEYQLLRLLDLNEVHAATPVSLKRHSNNFGLVLPTRTFYLQAESEAEVIAWVRALNAVRERLQTTASITPVPTPSTEPSAITRNVVPTYPASSPLNPAVTSSDEEDASPSYLASSPGATRTLPPARGLGAPVANDLSKPILSGYLMKCGKRKSWRKRWFVLTGEKLLYCGNHMDNKHQRQIPLVQVLDAMECTMPTHWHPVPAQTTPGQPSSPIHTALDELADPHGPQSNIHTFKIVTTKRTMLLCAPSEEEEIRWLSAVRALIARRSGSVVGALGTGTGKTVVPGAEGVVHGHVASGKGGSRKKSISAGGLDAAVEEVVGST